MKEHTKAVLEACTGQLVALGLTRMRRGLAVWDMNDEMAGGIGMQVQTTSSHTRILPMSMVVWEPVERLVAHGKGVEYRPWSRMAITRSKFFEPSRKVPFLDFKDGEVDTTVLSRFRELVSDHMIPMALSLADERAMLTHFRSGATKGGGRAEHALAILAWQNKTLDVTDAYGSLLTAQSQEGARSRLERFHHRLIASESARSLVEGAQTAGVK